MWYALKGRDGSGGSGDYSPGWGDYPPLCKVYKDEIAAYVLGRPDTETGETVLDSLAIRRSDGDGYVRVWVTPGMSDNHAIFLPTICGLKAVKCVVNTTTIIGGVGIELEEMVKKLIKWNNYPHLTSTATLGDVRDGREGVHVTHGLHNRVKEMYRMAAQELIDAEWPVNSAMKGRPPRNPFISSHSTVMEKWGNKLSYKEGRQWITIKFGDMTELERLFQQHRSDPLVRNFVKELFGMSTSYTKEWIPYPGITLESLRSFDIGYGEFNAMLPLIIYQWEHREKAVLGGGDHACYLKRGSSLNQFQFKADERMPLHALALAGGMSVTGNEIETPIGRVKVYRKSRHSNDDERIHFKEASVTAGSGWTRVDVRDWDLYAVRKYVGGTIVDSATVQ